MMRPRSHLLVRLVALLTPNLAGVNGVQLNLANMLTAIRLYATIFAQHVMQAFHPVALRR